MSRRDGATYVIRGLPPDLIPRCQARAREEAVSLQAVLYALLAHYADRTDAPSQQRRAGQQGGQARAARLSPERRSAIARHAALARHAKRRAEE